MLQVSGSPVLQGLVITLAMFHLVAESEGKRCLKREEIGQRVNNHYQCNHPIFSECCERNKRFTCCEPNWSKNIREQLQLWGMLGMMGVVGATICAYLLKDADCIRSDTLQEALEAVSRKFRIRQQKRREEKGKEARTEEGKMLQVSDTAPLTRNMAPPTLSTTSFTRPCQQI